MILLFQDPNITTPPADFYGFLLWVIGVLVFAIGSIVTMYVKSQAKVTDIYENRIKDKDRTIEMLRNDLRNEQSEKMKLIAEVKPALEAGNQIALNVFNLLTNERR